MMALISYNGTLISGHPEYPDEYNDPFDFFEFLKTHSDSLLNNDGYGITYYKENQVTIDSTQMWYKTTWYEDTETEPMNVAIDTIMESTSNATIVLGHDRAGSVGIGNHPFLFEWANKTYTFMHNGTLTTIMKQAFMNFLGLEWFIQHPSYWSGEFGDLNSFIDSELLFHYLMSFIIANNDVTTGIWEALNQNSIENINLPEELRDGIPVINFIMSDGNKVYVFRNFYITGATRNLSYEIFDSGFIGVKTQTSLENQITPNSLVILSSDENPAHINFFQADFIAQTTFGNLPLEVEFSDNSEEIPLSWNWDFQNDGIFDSFLQNPVFTYQNPGTYDVKLIVDYETTSDSLTRFGFITVLDTIPPSSPTNVNIEIVNSNTILSWDEVNTNIYGDSIDVNYYLILSSDNPISDFLVLGYTDETTFLHERNINNKASYFYKILAFRGSESELIRYIRKIPTIHLLNNE